MELENGISRGSSIYKVPGGKLIKVWLEVSVVSGTSGNILADIRLTGDFFVHPEEWIAGLEEELRGTFLDDVPDIVREKAEDGDVQLVGIEPENILHAIELAFKATGL